MIRLLQHNASEIFHYKVNSQLLSKQSLHQPAMYKLQHNNQKPLFKNPRSTTKQSGGFSPTAKTYNVITEQHNSTTKLNLSHLLLKDIPTLHKNVQGIQIMAIQSKKFLKLLIHVPSANNVISLLPNPYSVLALFYALSKLRSTIAQLRIHDI